MPKSLKPFTELETVNQLLVATQNELTRLRLMDRYFQRRVLFDSSIMLKQALATSQFERREKETMLKFLEEVKQELCQDKNTLILSVEGEK